MQRITHNTNDLEKQIVWSTLSNFMDTTTSTISCDINSAVAFFNEAIEKLEAYEGTGNNVQEMKSHATAMFFNAIANNQRGE